MWEKFTKIFNWVSTIPSEPNGNGSSSRIIGLSVAFTLVGLLIAFFCVTHMLPSAEQFYGMATFLGAACAGYAANKLSNRTPGGPSQGGQ